MRSEIQKLVDPRSRGSLDSRSQAFLYGRILKDPEASAANAADRTSSIHQMKSDTEELSNNRPTLINVGRRKLVSFARRLTDLATVCANCHRMLHRIAGKRADIRKLKTLTRIQRSRKEKRA
jgi:hypothetical protein